MPEIDEDQDWRRLGGTAMRHVSTLVASVMMVIGLLLLFTAAIALVFSGLLGAASCTVAGGCVAGDPGGAQTVADRLHLAWLLLAGGLTILPSSAYFLWLAWRRSGGPDQFPVERDEHRH